MRCGIVGIETRSDEADQGITPTIAHALARIVHGLRPINASPEKVPLPKGERGAEVPLSHCFTIYLVALGFEPSPTKPRAGCCWVMQWSVPKPQTRSTAWTPTTSRPGKAEARSPSASRSA